MKITIKNCEFDRETVTELLYSLYRENYPIKFTLNVNKWKKLPDIAKEGNLSFSSPTELAADLLMAGSYIYLHDYSCYTSKKANTPQGKEKLGRSNKGHKYMEYKITLKDFVRAAKTEEGTICVASMINDLPDSESSRRFIEIVLFGEAIYS